MYEQFKTHIYSINIPLDIKKYEGIVTQSALRYTFRNLGLFCKDKPQICYSLNDT